MFITEKGVDPRRLDPKFAQLIKDGGEILAEASLTNRVNIHPTHFLGFFAKAPESLFYKDILASRGITGDEVCEEIYNLCFDENDKKGMPIALTWSSLTDQSQELLRKFDQETIDKNLDKGNEALFLKLLLKSLSKDVYELLASIYDNDLTRFDLYLNRLEHASEGPKELEVFNRQTGKIIIQNFSRSGKRVLNLLKEDVASLGCRKITSKHLLYSLLGIDKGILPNAIYFQTIDPKQDVQSFLARELSKPGKKRTENFELHKDNCQFITSILAKAAARASQEGVKINEFHIVIALLHQQNKLVVDFLISRNVKLDALREYVFHSEFETEDEIDQQYIPISQIEAEIKKVILGQNHAIKQILPWVTRFRFRYPRERGAAAVLLFLGPSGTGKTQLAKELARIVYGSSEALLMLEMGQFNTKESINMFVGAPPGYVGYGEGKLTNGLRDNSECVVLFDEIEKAYEDVWVALLRFLDEGLIEDPAGPTRDGRKCIIVLTSNLGADSLWRLLPISTNDDFKMTGDIEDAVRKTVLQYLKRPEIYNRVDDKVIFRPFAEKTYEVMMKNQMQKETKLFKEHYNVELEIMPDVFDLLTSMAIDARQEGARCVPRIVNRHVVGSAFNLLAKLLEEGKKREDLDAKIIVSKKGHNSIICEFT